MARLILICAAGFLLAVSSTVASYESGPGAYESFHVAAPVAQPQGWSGGHAHNAGSYYHYHVPLVGQQQQHYHPQPQQNDHHHLYFILPLLLLAALPLLLVPLLPLLLLPLGLSLLALLLPLLMMGGMMMMMMMPGGMMMMMMRNADHPTRHGYHGEARTLGSYLYDDVTELISKYARSIDLDDCPGRLACEAGSYIYPMKAEEGGVKFLINYVVEKFIPKGRARRMVRSYEKAFWSGTSTGSCIKHKCQPKFNLMRSEPEATSSRNGTDSSKGANSQGASDANLKLIKLKKVSASTVPPSSTYNGYAPNLQKFSYQNSSPEANTVSHAKNRASLYPNTIASVRYNGTMQS